VPAVIAGVRVADGSNGINRVSGVVDTLNAMYKLSVIARRDEIAGNPMVIMDSTRQGIYGSIAATDKTAVTFKDSWMALSSSLGTLTNVVAGLPGKSGSGPVPAWITGLGRDKDCAAYMWVNFESASEAVRNAIAVYSLVLIAQNDPDAGTTRHKLGEIEKWVRLFKVMKSGSAWLKYDNDSFEVRFDLGAGK
jgi:hypothetical protein